MTYTRLNFGNELHAHKVGLKNSSATLKSSNTYQAYLIFAQRTALYTVWNANGNLEARDIWGINGLTFTASGTRDVTISWSNGNANLKICVLSYEPFTIQT